MFELIAQAASDGDVKGWAAIAASFTGSGILAWYLWYRTSVADPKQRDAEELSRAAERKDFREEMRLVRERGDQLATKGFAAMDKMCDSIEALSSKVDRMSLHCRMEAEADRKPK